MYQCASRAHFVFLIHSRKKNIQSVQVMTVGPVQCVSGHDLLLTRHFHLLEFNRNLKHLSENLHLITKTSSISKSLVLGDYLYENAK